MDARGLGRQTRRRTDISVMGSNAAENTTFMRGIAHRTAAARRSSSSDHDAVEEIHVARWAIGGVSAGAGRRRSTSCSSPGPTRSRADGSAFWFPDGLTSKPIKRPATVRSGKTGYTIVNRGTTLATSAGPIIKDRLWFFGGGVYNANIQSSPGRQSLADSATGCGTATGSFDEGHLADQQPLRRSSSPTS